MLAPLRNSLITIHVYTSRQVEEITHCLHNADITKKQYTVCRNL